MVVGWLVVGWLVWRRWKLLTSQPSRTAFSVSYFLLATFRHPPESGLSTTFGPQADHFQKVNLSATGDHVLAKAVLLLGYRRAESDCFYRCVCLGPKCSHEVAHKSRSHPFIGCLKQRNTDSNPNPDSRTSWGWVPLRSNRRPLTYS